MITKKIILMGLGGLVLISAGVFAWKSSNLDLPLTTNSPKVLSNTEIVAEVKPATVYIETTEGAGSGMIIDSEGYILTNAHVVEGVSTAKVKLSDGQLYSAEVKGRDEIIDVAILKISGENFPFVKFGNSDEIAQGNNVYTLGFPFGLEGDVSFKEGTISRRISDGDATYLETSAEIHPGNSGGPLVNHFGEVVGISSAGFGESIEGVTVGETIKLAIPINVVKGLIPDLKNGREILVKKKPVQSASKQKPQPPQPTTPQAPSQSQILQDQANQALLDELEKKDTDEAWKMTFMYNDAWRDNPARNCKGEATYSYDIALFIMQGLQDKMVKKYGSSLNWVAGIQHIYKSWCTDRGY